jgi:hypothetical protein
LGRGISVKFLEFQQPQVFRVSYSDHRITCRNHNESCRDYWNRPELNFYLKIEFSPRARSKNCANSRSVHPTHNSHQNKSYATYPKKTVHCQPLTQKLPQKLSAPENRFKREAIFRSGVAGHQMDTLTAGDHSRASQPNQPSGRTLNWVFAEENPCWSCLEDSTGTQPDNTILTTQTFTTILHGQHLHEFNKGHHHKDSASLSSNPSTTG